MFKCLLEISKLISPVCPFFSDWLYQNLTSSYNNYCLSVHMEDYSLYNNNQIDLELEEKTDRIRRICSMVRALRRKVNIKIRQPLNKLFISSVNEKVDNEIRKYEEWIKSEINVKEIQFINSDSNLLVKKVKPIWSKLGKKLGNKIPILKNKLNNLQSNDISNLERNGVLVLELENEMYNFHLEDAEILTEDVNGLVSANENGIAIALDIEITKELELEGYARELINKIQNKRKDLDFEVTDRINLIILNNDIIKDVFNNFSDLICNETLIDNYSFVDIETDLEEILINDISIKVSIIKNINNLHEKN